MRVPILFSALIIGGSALSLPASQNGRHDSRTAIGDTLPLFVTVYYHVEPNPQLFESVQQGYFEAVSSSLRQMSASLASIDVHATFCFSWLYNDIVYCRNHGPLTGVVKNSPLDTGIETFEEIVGEGHELAYHTHPPMSIIEGDSVYYARPDSACECLDTLNLHRWRGLYADWFMDFFPGVYEFDDPADPWYGQFTWERTSETLFLLGDYLGASVRHTNGGERPLLDITNKYKSGTNHKDCIRQIHSLMERGFDLIASECMTYFNPEYAPEGTRWSDSSTGYLAYFGPHTNVQFYYPDLNGEHLESPVGVSQGLTFMPVQKRGQTACTNPPTGTIPDSNYYDAAEFGGTGGGGVKWTDSTFYLTYGALDRDPWGDSTYTVIFPSPAEQFNNAMNRHLYETPYSVMHGVSTIMS